MSAECGLDLQGRVDPEILHSGAVVCSSYRSAVARFMHGFRAFAFAWVMLLFETGILAFRE